MKRLLMRAPASPFENPTHFEAIKENLVNGNSGNLLFVHSVARALMLEDVQIDFIKTRTYDKEAVAKYNEQYDAFVIPLANAFRKSFVKELRVLTKMVNQLDMPCIVIGVGFQDTIRDKTVSFEFDEDVRIFCEAVLKKSNCIGIRGELTARYLEHIGLERDKDFKVIGCPSMYLYGADLPCPKPLNLTKDIRVNLNCKVSLPQKIHTFMGYVREQIPNHYYIPQNQYELKFMYSQIPLNEIGPKSRPENYPLDFSHKLYQENRIRGFITAEAWFAFLRQGDLNMGTRIHGNIAGVLSGLPTFIIAPDARVLELAEYHNIPHTTIQELDENVTVFELLDGIDFNQVLDGHKERFEIFLKFLNDNGLDTIYNHNLEKIPFDEKMKEISFEGPIIPYSHAPFKERRYGRKIYRAYMEEKKPKTSKKPSVVNRVKRKIKKLLRK